MPWRPLLVAIVSLGAAFGYAASNVIEQRKAAAAPVESSMRVSLLWHLAHQPVWWLGIAADVGGFSLQVLALGLGSLVFVQPLLVTGLLFSLALGAVVGSHRLSRNDVLWALVLVISLSAFLLVASAHGGDDQRPLREWTVPLIAAAGVVASCAWIARRSTGSRRAALLSAAAGTMFGVSSTLMKSFAHIVASGGVRAAVTHWESYALGGVVALGFLCVQSAFQAGDLRAALPALEVAEPLVACVLGVVLMHEHLDIGSNAARAALVVVGALMVSSIVVLARSAAVTRGSIEAVG